VTLLIQQGDGGVVTLEFGTDAMFTIVGSTTAAALPLAQDDVALTAAVLDAVSDSHELTSSEDRIVIRVAKSSTADPTAGDTCSHDLDDGSVSRRRGGARALPKFRSTNDPAVRNSLVVDHTWIARTVARRFDQRGEAFDDLFQVASLGLVKAVDRFDPEMGTNFVSFAMPTVVGEVRRHFRDHTWSVRVPRRAKEIKPLITKAIEHLHQELGRSPKVSEIAAHLHIDEDDVLEAMEASAAYRASSLDAPMAVATARRHTARSRSPTRTSGDSSTRRPSRSCSRRCRAGRG
jgi:RNA polymerase sigma factor (sigma-70 family)